MKKKDRRVQYTKRVLKEALLELLKDRPINKITVTSLCEHADINRNTFYMHFGSPLELLSNIEEAFSNEIIRIIQHSKGTDRPYVFKEICDYIKENGELCRILFSEHGTGDYLQSMISRFFEISIIKWENKTEKTDVSTLSAVYSFISSGSSTVIKEWVVNGMHESSSEIATFVEKACKTVEESFLL